MEIYSLIESSIIENAGINFSSFILTFDKPLPKDTLRITQDFRSGQDLIVDNINGKNVKVRLITNDPKDYLDQKYLYPGVQYFIV